jgi:hypothetical protein
MFGKKAAFWVAVAGTAVLANFGMELAARRLPHKGLARFVEFLHNGSGTGQAGTV